MNWELVRLLFLHEARMLIRARRTVVMAIVLPAIVMPLMLYAQKYSADRRERLLTGTTYRYAITGEFADRVRLLIDQTRKNLSEAHDGESERLRQFRFMETATADVRASLDKDEIHFYIDTITGSEADKTVGAVGEAQGRAERERDSAKPQEMRAASKDDRPVRSTERKRPSAQPQDAERKRPSAQPQDAERKRPSAQPQEVAAPAEPRRFPGVPVINVIYSGGRIASDAAHSRMMELLRLARQQDSLALLVGEDAAHPKDIFAVQDANIATAGQITGSLVGRFITLFLVMMLFTGGAVAAMDIIAGEKERGTLETLLTSAAGRQEIVAAKQLAITSVALVITLLQGLNFFLYIRLKVVALPKNFDLQLPTGMALALLLLFIPLAATIGSVLLMISAYAKTYKEAQMYFFPVYLISLVPSLASLLPGISLRSAIAVVPVANVSVAAREILMGRPDVMMIAVTFAVMSITAAYLMGASARLLSREDIIVPAHYEAAEFVGGAALFQKRVLRWFALMWVVTFAVALNVPALATFRRQLLFNEIVVMMGAILLILKVYRLNPIEMLSLRPVRPVVWLAILFAIPSSHLTTLGVFRLVNIVMPAPQQLLERFAEDVIPKGMPTWQLLLYIALLPAVCEELAFRGILLNGLRRKFRPAGLILGVGLIFGFFHVMLYRIAPTAVLGMILTSIALMTGSVFPGMLLHAGNNAMGVVLRNDLNFYVLSWWHFLAAFTIFGLSLFIIYRNRTPLPTRGEHHGT